MKKISYKDLTMMNDDQNYYSETFQYERKFAFVAILATILAIGIIAFNFYSENLEDGFRDLIAEQGAWSQSQKNAVINLMAYVHSGTDLTYLTYEYEMYRLLEEKKGLEQIAQNPQANIDSFLNPLLGEGFFNEYENIELVYSIYSSNILSSLFPKTQLFNESISLKKEIFNYLNDLDSLGQRIRVDFENGPVSSDQQEKYVDELYQLNDHIIPLANQFTYNISHLSNSLKQFLLYNLIAIAIVFLGVVGMVSIRYIQKLSQWKNELFKQYNELRLIFASSQDGILLIDEKGEILKCNPSANQLLSGKDQKLRGKNLSDIFDSGRSNVEDLMNTARKQEYFNESLPVYLQDGSNFIASFSTSMVKDEKGEELLCIIIKDVTENVNHLRKINESEKTYRDLLNSIQDGIILMEPDGTFIRVNEAATTMFGYEEGEMIGMQSKDILASESRNLMPLSEFLNKTLEGEIVILDRWGRKKNRARFPLEITLSEGAFFDRNIVVGIFHDITDREKNIQQLYQAHEENRILLQEVHHRVKNNLAVINSFLQLERFRNDDDEKITSILANSESRIITIAKIHELLYTAGSFKYINVYEYISSIVDNLKQYSQLWGHEVTFDLKISKIDMNANQALPVGLIVNELVTNSIKHAFEDNKKGVIQIKIIKPDKDHFNIEISDNGKGLNIGSSKLEDVGNFGFTLVSTLTRQLEADLTVRNGGGTTFNLTFQNDDRRGIVSSLKK